MITGFSSSYDKSKIGAGLAPERQTPSDARRTPNAERIRGRTCPPTALAGALGTWGLFGFWPGFLLCRKPRPVRYAPFARAARGRGGNIPSLSTRAQGAPRRDDYCRLVGKPTSAAAALEQ